MSVASTTPAQTEPPPQYVTVVEFSKLSTIPVSTIRTRRCRQPEWGPPVRKVGRRVIYKLAEVEAWLDSHLPPAAEETV